MLRPSPGPLPAQQPPVRLADDRHASECHQQPRAGRRNINAMRPAQPTDNVRDLDFASPSPLSAPRPGCRRSGSSWWAGHRSAVHAWAMTSAARRRADPDAVRLPPDLVGPVDLGLARAVDTIPARTRCRAGPGTSRSGMGAFTELCQALRPLADRCCRSGSGPADPCRSRRGGMRVPLARQISRKQAARTVRRLNTKI